jgi:hypothetical protein
VGGMEQFAGQLLRGVLDVPQRIRVGAEIVYATTP